MEADGKLSPHLMSVLVANLVALDVEIKRSTLGLALRSLGRQLPSSLVPAFMKSAAKRARRHVKRNRSARDACDQGSEEVQVLWSRLIQKSFRHPPRGSWRVHNFVSAFRYFTHKFAKVLAMRNWTCSDFCEEYFCYRCLCANDAQHDVFTRWKSQAQLRALVCTCQEHVCIHFE